MFSRDGVNLCHVEVGLQVHFLKSTWFRGQIISSSADESRDAMKIWANHATEQITTDVVRRRRQPTDTPVGSSRCPSSTSAALEKSQQGIIPRPESAVHGAESNDQLLRTLNQLRLLTFVLVLLIAFNLKQTSDLAANVGEISKFKDFCT